MSCSRDMLRCLGRIRYSSCFAIKPATLELCSFDSGSAVPSRAPGESADYNLSSGCKPDSANNMEVQWTAETLQAPAQPPLSRM